MSLVSYGLPNLSNGVSQQPPALRLPTSCEEMVNGWASVLSGLQKRPPSEHIAEVSLTIPESCAGHIIRRDDSVYQYIVVVSNSDLKVYDLDGTPQTVNFPYGKSYLESSAQAEKAFRFMTFGDYTFIANREVTVRARTWGESGPDGTFAPTGTVSTYADLPTSPTLGHIYYVNDEAVYYKWENLPAQAQVVSWVATTDWQTIEPVGYSNAGQALPTSVTIGQKVYITRVLSTSSQFGFFFQFRGFTGAVTQAARPAGPGWKAYSLAQLGPNNSGRLDPTSYATVAVKQSVANSNYAIYVNGILKASYTTPTGTDAASSVPSTAAIATTLNNALNAAGVAATVIGSTISISGLSPSDKIVAVSPSGDKAMKAYRYSVESFSDLPPNEAEGRVIRIAGDPSIGGDDYYVVYQEGSYVEDVGWSAAGGLVNTTMPHVLIRNSDGTWTFKPHEWINRTTGDGESNQYPSFVGTKINDIFCFSNRLGFLADENVILSEANTFENFFRSTVAQLLEGDRIDVAVFSKDVNILRHAVPFAKDLLVTADNAQFRLTFNGVLSAKNVNVEYTTSYNVSDTCRPVNMGASVYFVDDRQGYDYGKILEYYVKENQTGDEMDDVTEAVPEYIPGEINLITASPRMKLLAVASSLEPTSLFAYRYYWASGQKVQNAWCRWDFPDAVKMHWADFLDNYLYMLIERSDGIFIERMQVDEQVVRNEEDVNILVDRKFTITSASMDYDPVTKKSTIVLPYSTTLTPECMVTIGGIANIRYPVTKVTGNQITVPGDVTSAVVVVGIPYTFSYTFSEQFLRKPNQKGTSLILEGRLQLRYLSLEYHNTAYFRFRVSTPGRDTVETIFEGRKISGPSAVLGTIGFASGTLRIPLMANSNAVTLEIVNDSPYACAFGSAEWQAQYQPKSSRIN